MHIIYNMYSKYTYNTVPTIIFIKENCSKIDFFLTRHVTTARCIMFGQQTVQMSKQALKMDLRLKMGTIQSQKKGTVVA